MATRARTSAPILESRSGLDPPRWIGGSLLLAEAYSLAASAHGSQRRPTDRRLFLDHVAEVGRLLDRAGCDDELVAVGLLHDAVERGTLNAEQLEERMGPRISSLVLALSEDPAIASFDQRKAGLRSQVERAGEPAMTVYAADKLSDILGLRRGVETHADGLEERMGTGVSSMAAHYGESVEMIEATTPDSVFLPDLHLELGRLEEAIRQA
ncbi:MAG: HD domain-containing protein [Solirubrobacterales bacterium]